MAAKDIRDVDIRLMIGRLRPTAEYHWKGDGDFGNTLEAIGEWRDEETQPPTEAEIIAEWDAYLQEQVEVENKAREVEIDLDAVRPDIVQAALDGIETDLAALAAANLNDTKQIIGRVLQRQRVIIKAVRHLVEKE